MLRQTVRHRVRAVALTNPFPEFVSLVAAGANMTPFRAIKADLTGVHKEIDMMLRQKADNTEIARVTFDAKHFADVASVKKWLDDGGYSEYTVKKADGGFYVDNNQAEFEGEPAPVPTQTDGVTVYVGKLKLAPVQPVAKVETKGAELKVVQKAAKDAKKPYGDVEYADPENGKYPINTPEHVKAAWDYINMPKNAEKYSASKLKAVKGKIAAAYKKHFGTDPGHGDKDDAKQVKKLSELMADADALIAKLPALAAKAAEARQKDMINVMDLIGCVQQLMCVANWSEYEEAMEGDDSTVPFDLRATLYKLIDILQRMTVEETNELMKPANKEATMQTTLDPKIAAKAGTGNNNPTGTTAGSLKPPMTETQTDPPKGDPQPQKTTEGGFGVAVSGAVNPDEQAKMFGAQDGLTAPSSDKPMPGAAGDDATSSGGAKGDMSQPAATGSMPGPQDNGGGGMAPNKKLDALAASVDGALAAIAGLAGTVKELVGAVKAQGDAVAATKADLEGRVSAVEQTGQTRKSADVGEATVAAPVDAEKTKKAADAADLRLRGMLGISLTPRRR